MGYRKALLFVAMLMLGGCYTQIRSPYARVDSPPLPSSYSQASAEQRFEYYRNYGQYELCDPYDFGHTQFYDSCLRWPYTRHINWYRYRVAWDHACWMSVYDRRWRWYSPVILTPYVVYQSPILDGEDEPQVVVHERPPIRRAGFEGAVPSADVIRTQNNQRTPTSTRSENNSDTSSKQTPEKKKEEDKEEKRTEKREERKKRGGMR